MVFSAASIDDLFLPLKCWLPMGKTGNQGPDRHRSQVAARLPETGWLLHDDARKLHPHSISAVWDTKEIREGIMFSQG